MKTLKRLKKEKRCIIAQQKQMIAECNYDGLQKNNDALNLVKEQIEEHKQLQNKKYYILLDIGRRRKLSIKK